MADPQNPTEPQEITYEVGHPSRSEVLVTTSRERALRELASLKDIYGDDGRPWMTPPDAD